MRSVERLILRKVLKALLAKYGTVFVSGERGYDDPPAFTTVAAALKEANEFDEAHILIGGNFKDGFEDWVYVIYGNGNGGWDMISDYTTNLEPILQPVLDFIKKEGD